MLVGTFGQTAHAIGSDPQRKHLWLDGGPGNGAQFYDVNVNHTNLPLVAQHTANYVHDSFVQNGLAYLSLSLIGTLGTFDVSNFNAVKVESLTPALCIGISTVLAPLLVLQPALGAGIASSKTPTPVINCLESLVTHTVYGLGLYLAALSTASLDLIGS